MAGDSLILHTWCIYMSVLIDLCWGNVSWYIKKGCHIMCRKNIINVYNFLLDLSYFALTQKKKNLLPRELLQLVNRASLITNLIHLSFESDIFLKFYLDVFYYVPLPTEHAN